MTEAQRKATLRTLLRGARDRLKPSDVGIETVGRRGCPGLRRDEVAELAEISETWYTRFECGQGRLSTQALNRVANVLRLAGSDLKTFFALARPELGRLMVDDRTVVDVVEQLSVINEVIRKLSAASSLVELAASATAECALVERCDVAYFGENVAVNHRTKVGTKTYLAMSGPRGADIHSIAPCEEISKSSRPASYAVFEGRTAFVPDMLTHTPKEAEIAKERNTRSWLAAPFWADGRLYRIGYANITPGIPSNVSIARLELLATVCAALLQSA